MKRKSQLSVWGEGVHKLTEKSAGCPSPWQHRETERKQRGRRPQSGCRHVKQLNGNFLSVKKTQITCFIHTLRLARVFWDTLTALVHRSPNRDAVTCNWKSSFVLAEHLDCAGTLLTLCHNKTFFNILSNWLNYIFKMIFFFLHDIVTCEKYETQQTQLERKCVRLYLLSSFCHRYLYCFFFLISFVSSVTFCLFVLCCPQSDRETEPSLPFSRSAGRFNVECIGMQWPLYLSIPVNVCIAE